MADYFHNDKAELDSPAAHAIVIIPADADLNIIPRALYVGTQGDLIITTLGDEVVTLVGIQGWVPIRVKRVAAASTASDIVGLY